MTNMKSHFYAKTINDQEISINLLDLSYIAKIQEEEFVNEDTEEKTRIFLIETFYTCGRMAKIPIFEEDYERLISEHKTITEHVLKNTDMFQARHTSSLVASEVTKIVEKSADWATELQDKFSENLVSIHQAFEDKLFERSKNIMDEMENRLSNIKEMEEKLSNIYNFVESFTGSIEDMDNVKSSILEELEDTEEETV